MEKSNSMASQLADVNRLNNNGLLLMKAMYEAITSNKETVTTTIELQDGTKSNIVIPSNIYIKSEVERLRSTINNMVGLGDTKSGTIVSINDGSSDKLRDITLTTFKKGLDKLKKNELGIVDQINITENPLIEKLLSPLTSLKITLPKRFNNESSVVVTKIFLDSLEGLSDGFSYAQTRQYLATNNIVHNIKEGRQDLTPSKQRFYGDFNIMSIENNNNDTFTCRFDKKTYNDSDNVVENSRELEVGNTLLTNDGLSIYKITNIVDNGLGVFVTVTHISGFSSLDVGISALKFYDDTISQKVVEVPVKGQDKFVLFFSSLDSRSNVQGVYSEAILVDTDNLKVVSNSIEFNFNTYFASNILGLGQHLESIVKDNTVPRSLATPIVKPVLDTEFFKVVQVNKHITNTADTKKLKKYSSEKNRLSSEISKITDLIKKTSTRINKGQYKSRDEKSADESTLSSLTKKKNDKQAMYNSTVDNIKSLSTFLSAPKASPKYRIQGFWAIDEPKSEITGDLQRVVRYNVRYKYVPSNSDVSESSSINVDGKEGLISAWNEFKTIPLKKTYDTVKKKFVWNVVNISDADVNNINQLEVPISYGENVVIQIQAIGEAGYPNNPILSEWSSPIKITFPEELAQDEQVKSIVEGNENDLVKVEVTREFESRGIDKLLSKAYTEQDRTFYLSSDDIASTEYTTEQKTISVGEQVRSLKLELQSIKELITRRSTSYSVELIAPNGRVYPVNKLGTVSLFAGHYTDVVDVNQITTYGNMVEVVFYLKLVNYNATSADITSISSGILTEDTTNNNYKDVPFSLVGSSLKQKQKNGQILYLRNKDVSGSNDLVYQNNVTSNTLVPSSDIESTTTDAEKTVVHFDGSTFSTVKMSKASTGTDYVVMTTSHPLYINYINNPTNSLNSTALVDEFNRIREFNDSLLEANRQQDYSSIDFTQFTDNDKYLIGKNSTGSKLFMRISDIQNIQVKTSDSSSSVSLQNGESNALLIPIVYQFRMVDALGRLNGDSALSLSASNIEYKKKMGVDLVVGNELFKFDLEVSSKFRKTTLSVTNSENSQIINSIDVQSSSTPNIV